MRPRWDVDAVHDNRTDTNLWWNTELNVLKIQKVIT